jgi:hypothetical protein
MFLPPRVRFRPTTLFTFRFFHNMGIYCLSNSIYFAVHGKLSKYKTEFLAWCPVNMPEEGFLICMNRYKVMLLEMNGEFNNQKSCQICSESSRISTRCIICPSISCASSLTSTRTINILSMHERWHLSILGEYWLHHKYWAWNLGLEDSFIASYRESRATKLLTILVKLRQ